MTDATGKVAYNIDGFFRIRHVDIEGRDMPYEFVDRIGAVTILPIITNADHQSSVLTINNERTHYGVIFETPGGNFDGGFDSPEDPRTAALRELQEEIGYQPADTGSLELFRMRDVSRSIIYPRYLAVARNLVQVGGIVDNPSEVITITPTPLEEYLDTLLSLSRGEAYPEVVLAFAKAFQTHGRLALRDWLVEGVDADIVTASFSPWLEPAGNSSTQTHVTDA